MMKSLMTYDVLVRLSVTYTRCSLHHNEQVVHQMKKTHLSATCILDVMDVFQKVTNADISQTPTFELWPKNMQLR